MAGRKPGFKHSEETKKKLSAVGKGRKATDASRKANSEGAKARWAKRKEMGLGRIRKGDTV